MKTPAVAIAACFVCGIVLGLSTGFAHRSTSHSFLVECSVIAGLLILAGLTFLRFNRLACGAAASLLSWIALGGLSAAIARQPSPPDHVVRLVDSGALDLHSPLRWHGTLRDEPARLPWGIGYEIELAGVDYDGATVPLHGGMRLSFTPHSSDHELPDLSCR